MSKALIIMDMQYDCCEGGPLAHEDSIRIIPKINSIRDDYDLVIFGIKSHPNNHNSFKQFGGLEPKNCIVNSNGHKIHDNLIINKNDIIIPRGTLQKYNSESIFYDAAEIEKLSKLKYILNFHNVKDLYFCGNGIDSSIFCSIIDAQMFNFNCHIIKDGFSYMNKEKADECKQFLERNNILFI